MYVESDVERLVFLRRLYAAGLSSRTILDLLPCVESPSVQSADDAWVRMVEERAHLDAHIDELLRTRDALDDVIAVNRRARAAISASGRRGAS